MMQTLPSLVRGSFFVVACLLNTVFFFLLMVPGICLKPLTDRTRWSPHFAAFLMGVVTTWASGNNRLLNLVQQTEWEVDVPEELRPNQWYLLMSNHRSWADIFVLFKVFNGRIPFPKFFVKDQLMWFPIFGAAFWGLGFPVMKRYSKNYLAKHPEHKGKDLETTRRSCEKFKDVPTTVVNFLEGSRYRPTKAKKQNSSYQHLLLPRAGGVALVLYSMGDYLTAAINVTIAYSDPRMTLWDFVCGDVKRIMVQAELIEIPQDFIHRDYREDLKFQENFQKWINQYWQEKDKLIEQFRSKEEASLREPSES